MSHRVLQSHVRRRYRAGARLALLATLLVGTAVSGVFAPPRSVEISQQVAAPPPAPAPSAVPAAVPNPEIEPAALPLPPVIAPAPTETHDALIIVGPAVEASASPAPTVERLIL